MLGQPAKLLAGADIRRALRWVANRRHPERNAVILLLSAEAGLRACEIARLTWRMVTNHRGQAGDVIELPAHSVKKGSGRGIPTHPMLRRAPIELRQARGWKDSDYVVRSERDGPMTPDSIVNRFILLYGQLGLQGCSSHSGRRAFITNAARLIGAAGGSLRDVQLLAGHWSLKTTRGYIEGSEPAQRRLVRRLRWS